MYMYIHLISRQQAISPQITQLQIKTVIGLEKADKMEDKHVIFVW